MLTEYALDGFHLRHITQRSGRTVRINEINLLGLNSDEAIAKLDKYLDDAYLSHLHSVRIVHGKGTGALRAAIHKYLRGIDFVSEFALAEQGEGDAGVTVVKF